MQGKAKQFTFGSSEATVRTGSKANLSVSRQGSLSGLRLAAVGSAFGKPPVEFLDLITLRLELLETVTDKLFIRLSDSIKQHRLTQEFWLRSTPSPHDPKLMCGRAVGLEKRNTPIHFNFGTWGRGGGKHL